MRYNLGGISNATGFHKRDLDCRTNGGRVVPVDVLGELLLAANCDKMAAKLIAAVVDKKMTYIALEEKVAGVNRLCEGVYTTEEDQNEMFQKLLDKLSRPYRLALLRLKERNLHQI